MSFVTKTTTSLDVLDHLYRVINGLEAANGLYVRATDSSATTTATTNSESTDSAKTTKLGSSLSGLDSDMPSLTSLGSSSASSSASETGMPSLSSSSTSSSSSSSSSSLYTTPSVTVPPSGNNPYISRTSNANGTVFIAFGAIVGAILLSFIAWHVINSLLASRAAKRGGYFKTSGNTTAHFSEKFAAIDNPGYNSNFLPSVSKLPLLLNHGGHSRNFLGPPSVFGFGGLQTGDTSTIYQLDNVSKNDMTRMFISPTADVLAQKRNSRIIPGSLTHLPLGSNGSNSTLHTPNRGIPNIYMSPDHTESEVLVMMGSPQQRTTPGRIGNLKIPSMVLDDLIDEERERGDESNK